MKRITFIHTIAFDEHLGIVMEDDQMSTSTRTPRPAKMASVGVHPLRLHPLDGLPQLHARCQASTFLYAENLATIMKHVRVKDLLARDPEIVVLNDGPGPLSGGLWNTSLNIGNKLVCSSTGKYCVGGASIQELDGTTGCYGKKTFLDLPGGALAWLPEGGFVSHDGVLAGFYHPVDASLVPIPGAAYPIFTHVGVPGFPVGSGQFITTGDITRNGHADIVIGLRAWEQDGYHPDGNRWSHPDYRPYEQRDDHYPGHDISRDEALPFWGSKVLAKFQAGAMLDPSDGHVRLDCGKLFGGEAGADIMVSLLPREGPWEFSLQRTYRGMPPHGRFAVFEGTTNGSPANIDEDEPSFEYAGMLNLENDAPLTVFSSGGACVLPGGNFVTVDFVGQIQYFRRAGPGLTFTEMPVTVEHGYIPAIHGCIGTVSTGWTRDGKQDDRLYFSGEFGITQAVKYEETREGLWIESPDEHVVLADGDFFKEDILVVPSFLDGSHAVLGSGAGRYSVARLGTAGNGLVGTRVSPFNRLRVQAGPVGSVQGTTEERWGYTCPTTFDLNGNGDPVVISGDISEYIWLVTRDGVRTVLRNPDGAPARVAWRVRPAVFVMEGRVHLVTLDQQNACTVFELEGSCLSLRGTIRLPDGSVFGTGKHGGSRGRLKFEAVKGKGKLPDLLVGTCTGVNLGTWTTSHAVVARFTSRGAIDAWDVAGVEVMGTHEGDDHAVITFGHHSCAPATVPEGWDGRSPRSGTTIVIGGEDGRLYRFTGPHFFAI